MSAAPATVLPAKLVVALLAGRAEWLDDAAERLRAAYGPTDVVSKVWPFDSTGYYASEMGADLLRQLLAFETLIDPGDLPAIKLATNALEADFAAAEPAGPPRPVNIERDNRLAAQKPLWQCSRQTFPQRTVNKNIRRLYRKRNLTWRQ